MEVPRHLFFMLTKPHFCCCACKATLQLPTTDLAGYVAVVKVDHLVETFGQWFWFTLVEKSYVLGKSKFHTFD